MHRHHALGGEQIIQRGEHRLLHLAGVARAADQHHPAAEIDGDDGFRSHPVSLGVGLERRQVEDRQIGDEIPELGGFRANQQIADEQRVPGVFREHPGLEPVAGIGAGIEILREQLLAFGMGEEIPMQLMELLRRDRTVVVPPHGPFGHRVLDDELVLRRAAGVDAGVRDERSPVGEVGLAGRDRMLVEARRRDVPMHGLQAFQAEFVGAVRAVPHTAFLHGRPSDCAPVRRSTGASLFPPQHRGSFGPIPTAVAECRRIAATHRPLSTNIRPL